MAEAGTATRGRRAGAAAAGKVTLEMVAEAAGVSAATVSRILNGTAIVSDDKRAAVDAAIARLGYVPNPVARGLAGGRTLSIGVVAQTLDSPFFGGALRGIETALDAAGYSPLYVSGHWNVAHEQRCIDTLRSRRVDGIILLAARIGDHALAALAQQLPVVVTGRRLQAPNLVALDFDNVEGARLATEHLVQLGHRRIAFIAGDMKHPDGKARLRGFRQAMKAAGLPDDLVLAGDFTEASGLAAVQQAQAAGQAFTAAFAANDQMAFGAAVALYRAGLRVPQDVSLVGFDDLAGALYTVPPLTTVHHPVHELGQLAAAAMLQLLAGQASPLEMPAPRLIVRESTAARAG